MLQGPAEPVGLNADDGIGILIEVTTSAEDTGRDGVPLDFVRSSGKRFFNDKFEKPTLLPGGIEIRALENPLELPLDFFTPQILYPRVKEIKSYVFFARHIFCPVVKENQILCEI
jgi:hypothetical protein